LPELAFIALGSNIEPEHYLPRAVRHILDLGSLVACSQVYQNPAIAPEAQPDYLNAAVLIETDLQPFELRKQLRDIETRLKRLRTPDKYAARTIDLDLCLFGDLRLESPSLTLPDPHVLTRAHLAITLAELSPEHIYPGSTRSLRSIAASLISAAKLTLRSDVELICETNPSIGTSA
jgi:2-amino-4-hydroxy-6-hydroxymethyldihydropteridine diphosphokinase